jgi:ketosteroid isomerase-like protein
MSAQGNNLAPGSESKPNVAVIRGFYEAADVPAMLEFLDPQIEWRGPDSLPWGGTFRGHDGFREFLAIVDDRIAEARREKQQYFDAEERVVVLLHSVARPKNGPGWDLPEVHVWKLRDGRAVSMDNYVDTAAVLRTLPDVNRRRGLVQ